MNPVKLQFRMPPAPANRLLAHAGSKRETVFIPVARRRRMRGLGTPVPAGPNVSLATKAHWGEDGLIVDLDLTIQPASTPAHRPVKLRLRMQPAPADLLRTKVRGEWPTVYILAPNRNDLVHTRGECIWRDGVVSLFAKARQGDDGLVIELEVTAHPPSPPAQEAAIAA